MLLWNILIRNLCSKMDWIDDSINSSWNSPSLSIKLWSSRSVNSTNLRQPCTKNRWMQSEPFAPSLFQFLILRWTIISGVITYFLRLQCTWCFLLKMFYFHYNDVDLKGWLRNRRKLSFPLMGFSRQDKHPKICHVERKLSPSADGRSWNDNNNTLHSNSIRY